MRIYLLSGLLLHKAVWEYMKRGVARPSTGGRTKLVKLVKLSILGGILAQTMLPEILPISQDPTTLRIIGACVYTLGLITAILGRVQLGNNWSDIETARVGERQVVVNRGIYQFIRHPIYSGDLFLL
ncbi:MAG: hypothetical protein WKF37_12940, partial [Bryobacteraceae bacterium]